MAPEGANEGLKLRERKEILDNQKPMQMTGGMPTPIPTPLHLDGGTPRRLGLVGHRALRSARGLLGVEWEV